MNCRGVKQGEPNHESIGRFKGLESNHKSKDPLQKGDILRNQAGPQTENPTPTVVTPQAENSTTTETRGTVWRF